MRGPFETHGGALLNRGKKPSISQKGCPVGRRPRIVAGLWRGALWTRSPPTRYNLAVFLACVATDKQNGAGRCRFGASFPSS
ncbi:hypothetical protein C7S15_3173 [Burkholderia cepacia]|nr:hypothetical protein [Burkholderia cepacia]